MALPRKETLVTKIRNATPIMLSFVLINLMDILILPVTATGWCHPFGRTFRLMVC
jgi:hypothetical protein